ncbi:MAG: class I SAM-dependent methyltransferase [Bacteriovoracia bacterium]
MGDSTTGVAAGYLHGFTRSEQDRLYDQARFLEPYVYPGVDFSGCRHLLEIGCGVGAQTEILLRLYPKLKITGVDAAAAQLERARERHAENIQKGRVQFQSADALRLPFPDGARIPVFDGAYLCWILEHVPNPLAILKEARRALAPGSPLYAVEVFNSSFFVAPESPMLMQYWRAYNELQSALGADPDVGIRVPGYLHDAGFRDIRADVRSYLCDRRNPEERTKFFDYWETLILSGAPQLVERGTVTSTLVEQMKLEFNRLRGATDSVFFYTWTQVSGRA